MYRNMQDIVDGYIASAGKKKSEVAGWSVVSSPTEPKDRPEIRVEIVCKNDFVEYTRVGRIILAAIEFADITSKTRLHVSASDVPDGAEVYWDGEWWKFHSDVGHADGGLLVVKPDGVHEFLADDETVGVTCFLSPREGIVIGGVLAATTEEIAKHGASPGDLVDGCKFELVELAAMIRGSREENDDEQ